MENVKELAGWLVGGLMTIATALGAFMARYLFTDVFTRLKELEIAVSKNRQNVEKEINSLQLNFTQQINDLKMTEQEHHIEKQVLLKEILKAQKELAGKMK